MNDPSDRSAELPAIELDLLKLLDAKQQPFSAFSLCSILPMYGHKDLTITGIHEIASSLIRRKLAQAYIPPGGEPSYAITFEGRKAVSADQNRTLSWRRASAAAAG